MPEEVRTRFAPSPTGHLHLGGARTAIFNWLLARHFGGKFSLRIEDTDLLRSKQEYTDSILASMRWLGLDWDGELIYQTKRTELYNSYVDKLLEMNKAYWCACTSEEVEAMRVKARSLGQKPRYDGHCRDLGLGFAPGSCVRLRLPDSGRVSFNDLVKGPIAVDIGELDDFVIRRADGMPTYNLAVVVDDHEMGLTHIIRGDDHISNTPKQILIYQALGLEIPKFGHVPMILGKDKQKLSKRHGAKAVIEYEKDGLLPEALVNYLARLGWSHGDQELFSLKELIEYFDGTNLNPSAACFDEVKLSWCNAQFLRSLPLEELALKVQPFVERVGLGKVEVERLLPLCVMFRERSSDLLGLAQSFRPLLVQAGDLEYVEKDQKKHFTPQGLEYLLQLENILAELEPFSADQINQALNDYVESNNLRFKEVAPPLRCALMGFMGGSHLHEIMEFLGREETLDRIERARTFCM
ncbi:MAG: glutamate--tRNA ligase [Desulfovibrionaceae bacterium]|nr:glutamate--tRNA ligase [Desulfovibrionaceae bacterium]